MVKHGYEKKLVKESEKQLKAKSSKTIRSCKLKVVKRQIKAIKKTQQNHG